MAIEFAKHELCEAKMQIEPEIKYICPRDRSELNRIDNNLVCSTCQRAYPIVRTIPILIDDDRSVFSTADYLKDRSYEGASYGNHSDRSSGLRHQYRRFAHWLTSQSVNIGTFDAGDAIRQIELEWPGARILIIGAGDTNYIGGNHVYTDVAFGRSVTCICDAHSLPFGDEYFDGAVCVAVLEHVADPFMCVDEIKRVLKPRGLIYSSVPFLQPVHMGAYDFTRFTYLGHRRLFRWFDDIESGSSHGPAASTVFALQHVLMCFSDSKTYRKFARLAGLLLALPLKQIDRLFRKRKGVHDAAASVYFFGRKRDTAIRDKEIIRMYRGAQ